jgi:DNA polymerase III epsilon subunit-like protein
MKLPPFSFVVLDTETTGFVPRVHHVIEYAAMRAEGGKITDTYEQLFAIKEPVPPMIQVLTRIKPDALMNQPVFSEKLAEIEEKLKGVDLLIGQNLGFDINMLKGEGINLTERAWVDTSMLASLVFPEFRSYSLGYMSAQLKLNHEPAHRALGDVRATLEMLTKIWERLLELPPEELKFAKDVMSKSSPGYALFFDALPKSISKKASWISPKKREKVKMTKGSVSVSKPPVGTVELHEEGLHCNCLQDIINASVADDSAVHWIAVKNLESSLKRLHIPDGVTVIHPPQLLLNPEAMKALKKQEKYNVEEAFLLLKNEWFNPRTRNDIAIHGNEKDLWNGKVACAATTDVYVKQFAEPSSVFLIDHRQLLSFLTDPAHAAHGALKTDAHIIVDDASMLEDTATKAFGHYLGLDGLRAAAGSDKELLRFTDLFALFAEQIRHGEDQYYLTPGDLRRSEVKALREQLEILLKRGDLPEKTLEQLREAKALTEENLVQEQIVWLERRMDGSLSIISAPKNADKMLNTYLYSKYATTLLVPKGSTVLPEIVPPQAATKVTNDAGFTPCPLTVSFPSDMSLMTFMQNPLPGKTIVLAGSKRVIEQMFILHTERLESEGVTLICQGTSGGQNRMESEFIAAESPAILMITPFMYEGLDFPEGTADRLVLDSVPFDHPNHPVMSVRKNHYKNSFMEYAMPRVEYRLFRLMRTFCRHRRENAEMMCFDKRLFEKDYGARLQRYMAQFATNSPPIVEAPAESVSGTKKKTPAKKKTSVKKAEPKTKADGQMQLPL